LLAGAQAKTASDSELAVYRDQLAEIENERARGLIAGAEAEGARVEVARRLIKRAEERTRAVTGGALHTSRAQSVAIYAAAALPVIGLAAYLAVGSPALPGRPYAERLTTPVEQASAADLIARVEAHLRQHPEDGKGWDVLAPVYLRTGNYPQALDAYQRAIRLLGESPKRLAGFARATIFQQNGLVNEDARLAYEKLRQLEPESIEPKVWLAIAREQDGDLVGAAAEYRALLAADGDKGPWRGLLEERLRAVTQAPAGTSGPAAPDAKSDDAMAAVAAMSPEERERVIGQMVAGLAERLKKDGNDLEGWMRLVRSYVVLGKRSEATSALADARSHFAGNEKSLAELDSLAASLGLGS
jgi:cytochrome c-type biogenesis protein CcmH